MKHWKAFIQSSIILGGLGTALYLFVTGRPDDASTLTIATILILIFI